MAEAKIQHLCDFLTKFQSQLEEAKEVEKFAFIGYLKNTRPPHLGASFTVRETGEICRT
jgi:hypothetical protein